MHSIHDEILAGAIVTQDDTLLVDLYPYALAGTAASLQLVDAQGRRSLLMASFTGMVSKCIGTVDGRGWKRQHDEGFPWQDCKHTLDGPTLALHVRVLTYTQPTDRIR